MCGIAGKYFFKQNAAVSPELIKKMCDVMAYRGPDDSGVYVAGPVGLGHRRLSILDLSELGHQPMATPDQRLWITYNGEVYNFLSLKKDLEKKGYNFRSNCDTEVLLALYREHGKKCLDYLEGMFAFAIWDSGKKELFLARDRIGKKPLFYFFSQDTFIFASEIKCILQDPIVRRKINLEALVDYFKYLYVPDPKTIFENIFKLKPGHFLVCNEKGIREQQYWDISFAEQSNLDEAEIAEQLLALLRNCVKKRLISDVPLGAFLSGGIDSSGVVALMAGATQGPVTTCSIGFDSEAYDEVRFARTIAEKFKTDHHEFTVKQKAEEILSKLAFYFDEPFADASSVPTYYVSKLARQRVTVALSGDGGDENFAGYEKYHLDDIENSFRRKIPKGLRHCLFPPLSDLFFGSSINLLRRAASLMTTLGKEADYGFYLSNSEFDDRLWQKCISDDFAGRTKGYDPSLITRFYYNRAETEDHVSKILYTDMKSYLVGDILVKVDRMSMANSLEVRAPILDHTLMEFAASIPSRLKFNKGEKKYILKKAFEKVLPPEIMYRKKMGFSVPLADWLRGELREFSHSHIFSREGGLEAFFQKAKLENLWQTHQNGAQNHGTILWALLQFSLWHREFMT